VNGDKTFLIDTSALITPYRQYYAFDLVPSFWEKLKDKNPKIPDVAKALGVDTIPLFEMMRRLKIKI
jgi:hypothetical protein